MRFFDDPPFTDMVRAILAVGLTISLPVILFGASPDAEVARTYQDAVAAVVAFYFGTATAEQQP
jgi:hypothetical protein